MKSMRKLPSLMMAVALIAPAQRLRLPVFLHGSSPAAELNIRVEHGIPFVYLQVNGSAPLPFILDTGSTVTQLSKQTMADLKLRGEYELPGTLDTAGARTDEKYVVVRKIRIADGKTEILRGTVEAIDLSWLSEALHVQVAGLLGFDVLKAHPVVLDFGSHRMQLYRSGSYKPRSSEHKLESADCGADPVFSSEIQMAWSEHPIPLTLMIDTGSQHALVLNSPFVKEHSLSDLPSVVQTKLAGAVGTFPVERVTEPMRMSLGGEARITSDIFLSQAKEGRSARTYPDGHVGLPLFSDQALVLNCPSGYIAVAASEP